MSNKQMAGFEVQCVPQTKAYAQKAIFEVMRSGGWYTVRQLMEKARVSDPRGNIRTMIKRGYCFEKRSERNSHGIIYKLYRLNIEETERTLQGKNGTQILGTKSTQNLGTVHK